MSDSWADFIGSDSEDLFAEVAPTIDEKPELTSTDIEELAANLLLDGDQWLREAFALLMDRKQLILYGPPGTGKTFIARAIATHLVGKESKPEVVQFHPSYTYEQFVEGYRPVVDEVGTMVYRLQPGTLVRLAELARLNEDRKFVLLIDEINRGNLPKIFGELLYLLEYRDESVHLMYQEAEGAPFALPPNLYFLGTMNSADRSIGTIDAALRRRFHFLGLFPNRVPIIGTLDKWIIGNAPSLGWLPPVVDHLNERLAIVDSQIQVGQSFFMRKDIDEALVDLIWKADVLPYLEDQLFGREDVAGSYSLASLRSELERKGDPPVDENDLREGA
jgi:5-methylcytosine-specific restriction protein B